MIPELEIRLAMCATGEPVIWRGPLDVLLLQRVYYGDAIGIPKPGTELRAVLRWDGGEARVTFKVPEHEPEEGQPA